MTQAPPTEQKSEAQCRDEMATQCMREFNAATNYSERWTVSSIYCEAWNASLRHSPTVAQVVEALKQCHMMFNSQVDLPSSTQDKVHANVSCALSAYKRETRELLRKGEEK